MDRWVGGFVSRWMDLGRKVEKDKGRMEGWMKGWMNGSYEDGWVLDNGWEKDGRMHAE